MSEINEVASDGEIRSAVDEINRRVAAGELRDRDRYLLVELVDDRDQGVRDRVTAVVRASSLNDAAQQELLALLAWLPPKAIERVAARAIELYEYGYVEGRAAAALALLNRLPAEVIEDVAAEAMVLYATGRTAAEPMWLEGYGVGLAGLAAQEDIDPRYLRGHADGQARRRELLGERWEVR